MASELFQRIAAIAAQDDPDGGTLHHDVWDGTPWMTDAYEGRKSRNDERVREMLLWCVERFGREASPIHGIAGRWHRAGFTLDGWTWFGFDTDEAMREFQDAWPVPEGVEPQK